MLPIGKLKSNLEFNKSLGGIIEALKIAASLQLRQFQEKKPLCEGFLRELRDCLAMLETTKLTHPFFRVRRDLPRCIVGITSDEGFLGELNTLIINTLLDQRKLKDKDKIVVLGERGVGYLEDMDISCTAFPGIKDELSSQEVDNLKNHLIKEYLKGGFGEIVVVYSKFISITTQQVDVLRLIPFSFELISQIQDDGMAKKPATPFEDLLLEASSSDVIEGLMNLWSRYILSDIFYSSKLSELSARLMHLDGSEQELTQVNKRLKLEYFRHVHMLADQTIREISASRFLKKS